MTFSELADAVGISSGALRSDFSRHKLSIHNPKDLQKFLAKRFSGRKINRAKRPWQTAKHLQKWRFVKKVRREQNLERRIQKEKRDKEHRIKEKVFAEKIAWLENENSAAMAKLKIAEEKLVAKNSELKTENEKLAQKSALVAAKERKIATLMRQNSEFKIQTRREQKPLSREPSLTPLPLPEKQTVKPPVKGGSES